MNRWTKISNLVLIIKYSVFCIIFKIYIAVLIHVFISTSNAISGEAHCLHPYEIIGKIPIDFSDVEWNFPEAFGFKTSFNLLSYEIDLLYLHLSQFLLRNEWSSTENFIHSSFW